MLIYFSLLNLFNLKETKVQLISIGNNGFRINQFKEKRK